MYEHAVATHLMSPLAQNSQSLIVFLQTQALSLQICHLLAYGHPALRWQLEPAFHSTLSAQYHTNANPTIAQRLVNDILQVHDDI